MGEIFIFLFPPFVACLLMVLMFGYLGIHVLKREIIFIDIALAQIAAVGSTLAFVIWRVEEDHVLAYLTAFGFTVLASLFYAQAGKRIKQIPHEAIIGVSYAVAAAAALFMMALAAGGDVHLEHMLTGSILWAKWSDILVCAVAFVWIGLIHCIFYWRFIRLSESMERSDYHEKSPWWDFLFYVTMGVVITISIRIAGVLVVFSLLIIPATFSALFATGWGDRLRIAYALGISATLAGLIFSYTLDFSCGPSVVTFLGIGLIIGVVIRKKEGRKSGELKPP
ncbi:metal ABC transporter permease [bacterium]|nr:metal ABC transporter permease [bacterium]